MDEIIYLRNNPHIRKSVRNSMEIEKAAKKITFQEAMRACLIIGKVVSLMPVVGVSCRKADDVRFTLKSWTFGYLLLSFLGHTFMSIMFVTNISQSENMFNDSVLMLFFMIICCILIAFVQIARSWPALVQHITRTEELDPNFDNKLKMKCNVTCIVMTLLAVMEYTLLMMVILATAANCIYTKINSYEQLTKYMFSRIFDTFNYSRGLGLFLQFLHFQNNVMRYYLDLFIICIGYCLISRLEQVNKKMIAARGKYLPEIFWRSAREEYTRATDLVRKVDQVIGGIIIISFATNLFIICLQMFYTLRGRFSCMQAYIDDINKATVLIKTKNVYFLISFIFAAMRSAAVANVTSRVHTVSMEPASVLYAVPSPVYCNEVQRFLEQVNGKKVALSGLKFFHISRELILTIIGTIITYVLVLLEFNEPFVQDNSTNIMFPNMTATMDY